MIWKLEWIVLLPSTREGLPKYDIKSKSHKRKDWQGKHIILKTYTCQELERNSIRKL